MSVKRKYLCADEAPIQVLKEKDRRPQTKSYIWLFRSGDDGMAPIIIYKYHPTHNGDAAADFFKNNPDGSYIMADGYAGYNKLKDFNRCCCYAHIRRYFIEAIPKGHEKISPIRQSRECSTVTNFLSMNAVTGRSDYHINRYITVGKGIRKLLLRLFVMDK